MGNLHIKNFPAEIIWRLKFEALEKGMTLRDYCIGRLGQAGEVPSESLGSRTLASVERVEQVVLGRRRKSAKKRKGVGDGVSEVRVSAACDDGGVAGVSVVEPEESLDLTKDMGAGVPVQDGRDTRVPSDGASSSRVVEAVPAKNNSGFLGSDAPEISGVDLRGDDEPLTGPATLDDVFGGPMRVPVMYTIDQPVTIEGGRAKPTEALRAIAAGDFPRAPQVPEESAGDAGAPTPNCASCETPLEEGRGKMAGKFACGDQACGMFGKEQKGKR